MLSDGRGRSFARGCEDILERPGASVLKGPGNLDDDLLGTPAVDVAARRDVDEAASSRDELLDPTRLKVEAGHGERANAPLVSRAELAWTARRGGLRR